MVRTAKDKKDAARLKAERSLWPKVDGFHPINSTEEINHALVAPVSIEAVNLVYGAMHAQPSEGTVAAEIRTTKQVLVFFADRSLLDSNATSPVDWSQTNRIAITMQTLLYFLLECANVRILPEPICADGNNEEDGEKEKDDDRKEIVFPLYDNEEGVATTEVFLEAVYGDEGVHNVFLGWRWWFVAHAPRFFWGSAIRERLLLNVKRYTTKLRGKVPVDMPHYSVLNAEDVARLFRIYLGEEAAGGFQRSFASAIAGMGATDVLSLDDPTCVANPCLRIFTLKNACTNLKRFKRGTMAASLPNAQPDHRQCGESTYFQYGINTRTVRLVFPRPDQVWRVHEENWHVESLGALYYPSFQDERMRLLGQALANNNLQIGYGHDENTIREAADAFADMDFNEDAEVNVVLLDDQNKHFDDMALVFTKKKGMLKHICLTRDQQLEARNALLTQRRVNGETWRVIDRQNLTFSEYKIKMAAYKTLALSEFVKSIMIRNHQLLSDADRTIVNWILEHELECHTKHTPFFMEWIEMYDSTLSPEADWIAQCILGHELGGIATMHKTMETAYTAQYDAFRYGNNMHMNLVTTGRFGVGKSKLQEYLMDRHIQGVSVSATHQTRLANMMEKDTDSTITFFEELPTAAMGGMPGQGEMTGDPTYKARLTRPVIAVVYFASDPETHERTRIIAYSSQQGSSLSATNEPWNNMAQSTRSRHMRIAMPEWLREGCENYKKNVHIGTGTVIREIEEMSIKRAQLEMALVWLVERMIMCHIIRDVDLTFFHIMTQNYYNRLDAAGVNTRCGRSRRRVELLARTLTIRFAIHSVCFSEASPLNFGQSDFDIQRFATLIEVRLVCDHDLVNMAMEMGIDQFVDPQRAPVMRTMASICDYTLNIDAEELQEEREAAAREDGTIVQKIRNPQHARLQGVAKQAEMEAAQQAEDEMIATLERVYKPTDVGAGVGYFSDSDEELAMASASSQVSQIPMDIPNERPVSVAQAVSRTVPRTKYRTVIEPGGEKIDYDYIRIKGTLPQVAMLIQLNCTKSVKPSVVDIEFAIREMSKAMIVVYPRSAHREKRKGAKKHTIRMALINDGNDPSICLATASLDTIRTDILSSIINTYTTPYLDTWDSVEFFPKERMPFIMSRRTIKSCDLQEYKDDGNMELIFNNPNAISPLSAAATGRNADEDANMTDFCKFKNAYNHSLMEFKHNAEEDVIDWHITMCGIDSEDVPYAYPECRRNRTRILWRAKQIRSEKTQTAKRHTEEGQTQYWESLIQAEKEDTEARIQPPVRYPIEAAHDAFMPIVARYKIEIKTKGCDTAIKEGELRNYTAIYKTILHESRRWLTNAQYVAYEFDETDTVAVERIIRDNMTIMRPSKFSSRNKRKRMVVQKKPHQLASALQDADGDNQRTTKRARPNADQNRVASPIFRGHTENMRRLVGFSKFNVTQGSIQNILDCHKNGNRGVLPNLRMVTADEEQTNSMQMELGTDSPTDARSGDNSTNSPHFLGQGNLFRQIHNATTTAKGTNTHSGQQRQRRRCLVRNKQTAPMDTGI